MTTVNQLNNASKLRTRRWLRVTGLLDDATLSTADKRLQILEEDLSTLSLGNLDPVLFELRARELIRLCSVNSIARQACKNKDRYFGREEVGLALQRWDRWAQSKVIYDDWGDEHMFVYAGVDILETLVKNTIIASGKWARGRQRDYVLEQRAWWIREWLQFSVEFRAAKIPFYSMLDILDEESRVLSIILTTAQYQSTTFTVSPDNQTADVKALKLLVPYFTELLIPTPGYPGADVRLLARALGSTADAPLRVALARAVGPEITYSSLSLWRLILATNTVVSMDVFDALYNGTTISVTKAVTRKQNFFKQMFIITRGPYVTRFTDYWSKLFNEGTPTIRTITSYLSDNFQKLPAEWYAIAMTSSEWAKLDRSARVEILDNIVGYGLYSESGRNFIQGVRYELNEDDVYKFTMENSGNNVYVDATRNDTIDVLEKLDKYATLRVYAFDTTEQEKRYPVILQSNTNSAKLNEATENIRFSEFLAQNNLAGRVFIVKPDTDYVIAFRSYYFVDDSAGLFKVRTNKTLRVFAKEFRKIDVDHEEGDTLVILDADRKFLVDLYDEKNDKKLVGELSGKEPWLVTYQRV